MEPYDDSVPEILKTNGVYSHLASDHQHDWEDGGATYHTRCASWESFRGQEGDPWKADLNPGITPAHSVVPNLHGNQGRVENYLVNRMPVQDMINRAHIRGEKDMPQAKTFAAGLEFLETNWTYDNWFLQIETFDPHEPFFTQKEYQALYEDVPIGGDADWPPYGPCNDSEDVVRHVRNKYAALVSMCDSYLGKVLDFMDSHDMWKDTALIVTTDHGYLLGEHDWWSKSIMPLYNEVSHIPMFAWDPRVGVKGERRSALVQNADLAPTLLELNGLPLPKDMLARSIRPVQEKDEPIHDCVLFGHHASHINITDGRFVYMRAPLTRENAPAYEYTLMPTHMRALFSPQELKDTELREPFSFTKGLRLMKIPAAQGPGTFRFGTKLFDLRKDPQQLAPIQDPDTELRLINRMRELMLENDAPAEQYSRMGIPQDHPMTMEELTVQKAELAQTEAQVPVEGISWTPEAKEQFHALKMLAKRPQLAEDFQAFAAREGLTQADAGVMEGFVRAILPGEAQGPALNTLNFLGRRY